MDPYEAARQQWLTRLYEHRRAELWQCRISTGITAIMVLLVGAGAWRFGFCPEMLAPLTVLVAMLGLRQTCAKAVLRIEAEIDRELGRM